MQAAAAAAGIVARDAAIMFIILSVMVAGILVARRNLRLGRGDRRGALRVALYISVLFLVEWLFLAHHVAVIGDEFEAFLLAVAQSVYSGFFIWLSYIAIEPIARRRWPQLLISWSRLLAGRFRDPLVGRDALTGILFGAGVALTLSISNGLPTWVDLAGMTPMPPAGQFLLGVPALAGSLSSLLQDAVERGLGDHDPPSARPASAPPKVAGDPLRVFCCSSPSRSPARTTRWRSRLDS